MPIPFENEHVLIVEPSEEEMRNAILKVLSNKALKEKLERNAYGYWEKIAKPESVIRFIINRDSEKE